MSKLKKVLYAGTFDPITNGHLDIIKRGSKLAEQFVVCIFANPEKMTKYSIQERVKMIKFAVEGIKNIKVDNAEGLLSKYVNNNNIDAVLRGLRAGIDFEYEISMAQLNEKFYKKAETIFLMTNPVNSFISSSIVREVFSYNGDISHLLPSKVYNYMKKLKEKE